MGGSRTVKTLAVLFVAMTLGALALRVLETDPIHPTPSALEVLSSPPAGPDQLVSHTLTPLQSDKWRSVFVHAARDESSEPAKECHFVVAPDGLGGWKISPTDHWMRQEPGQHVEGVWKNTSVGICLIGDFSRTPPKSGQFELLVQLVNALQETCRVPADHVYLLSDIDPRSPSPGAAFPAAKLSARLLRPL